MPWTWPRLKKGIAPAAAIEILDRELDRLQRALYTPDLPTDLPYSTSITPKMLQARRRHFRLIVTNATAFTINKPEGLAAGALVTFEIVNQSGGAMGALTWAGEYLFLTAWANPANGNRATATFYCATTAQGTGSIIQLANQPAGGGGGGEANTASNVGSAGVGTFDAKVGVDLQFRKLNALSARLTAVLDAANKKIDLDVVEAQLLLQNLGGLLVTAQITDRAVDMNKLIAVNTQKLLGRSAGGAGNAGEIGLSAELALVAGALGIVAGGVTKAMQANIATARLLGRTTAGAGVIEELTVGAGLKLAAGALTQDGFELATAADQATFVNAQTNITGLSFAIAASEIWSVDICLSVAMGAAAAGVKFYFTFPAGCTGEIHYGGNVATLPTWQTLYQAVLTVPGTFFVTGIITGQYTMRATIRNGGTPGTIQLVGITGGATTTCAVKKGSQMNAWKVP